MFRLRIADGGPLNSKIGEMGEWDRNRVSTFLPPKKGYNTNSGRWEN